MIDKDTGEKWHDLDNRMFNDMFNPSNGQTNCYVQVKFANGTTSDIVYIPVYPDDVNDSISTSYGSSNIIGRPGEISSYNNTGDQTTSFSLHMHREQNEFSKFDTNSGNDDTNNHIDKVVRTIKSAHYPLLSGSGSYAPIVYYKFGDTYITGKQTSTQVKWSGTKIGGKYMEVTINISVTQTPNKVVDYNDIINLNPRQFGKL